MSYFDCRAVFASDEAARQATEKLENDPVIESELFHSGNILNTAVWDINHDTEFDNEAVVSRLVSEKIDYSLQLCDAMMRKGALLCIISGHEDNYCSTLAADEPDEILSSSIEHSNWVSLSNLIHDEFSGWLVCIAPELAAKHMDDKIPIKLVSQNSMENDLNDLMNMAARLMKGRSPGTEYSTKERYQIEYSWRYKELPQTLIDALKMQGYTAIENEEEYTIFTKKDNLPVLWR